MNYVNFVHRTRLEMAGWIKNVGFWSPVSSKISICFFCTTSAKHALFKSKRKDI